MTSGQKRVWTYVAHNWRVMQEHAPGYEAEVSVYIAGRPKPLLLSEARSKEDLPFAEASHVVGFASTTLTEADS